LGNLSQNFRNTDVETSKPGSRRLEVGAGAYTDPKVSKPMVEVFSALHKSGEYIPGEEPLHGTHTCRFTGADLSRTERAAELAHTAHFEVVNKAAREKLNAHILPLEGPCSFYLHGTPRSDPMMRKNTHKDRCLCELHTA
jgi:hypothetical protein